MFLQIDRQIELLGIPPTKTNKLYFYGLPLSGRQCLKMGKTKCDLSRRICRYLFDEQSEKEKNMDLFRLFCVFEFDTEELLNGFESVLKKGFKKYPLFETQHGNTEQYNFQQSWPILKQILENDIPFCSNKYVHPDVNSATR